ncbi:MAG: twin-arginine translocase subunit TatC [Acidimicrobiales bacterium]
MKVRRKRSGQRRLKGPDDTMTLTEHLAELRRRIVVSFLAVAAAAVVMFVLYDPWLQRFLGDPYFDLCAENPDWKCSDGFQVTDLLGAFTTRLRIAGYFGLAAALPVVLWQIWRFVVPGLHAKERRYAAPFVLSSVVLFLFGASIAYLTMPFAVEFLVGYAGAKSRVDLTADRYINLISLMMIGFGVGFLFPVLLVFLQLAGALTPGRLLRWWRQAIVLCVVIAAVITPSGDPFSLLALAIPMTVFYFGSVLIGWLLTRKRSKAGAGTAAA